MSKSHKYNLFFRKSQKAGGAIIYNAAAKEDGSADLATFLTQSDLSQTLQQIAELPDIGNVKVGETILPNADFKEILQEWLEYIHPFSIENEVRKLRKYTMLPITHVVFDERYQHGENYIDDNLDYIKILAKLYIAEHYIGEIQYMSSNFGPMYETQSIQQLVNWQKVVDLFHQEILAEVLKQEPRAALLAVQNYEILSVKNAEGTIIKNASFKYFDGRWNINVYSLYGELGRMSVSVELTPPNPDF